MACSNSNCSGGCMYGCSGGCSGCSGCTSCTGCTSCSGSCKGCTGCSGTCKGCTSCSGGCGGGCGGCTNACSGCKGCTNACTGCKGCTNSCTGCKNTCTGQCNSGCTTTAQVNAYNALTRTTYFEASNINAIALFIYNEANRRGSTTPTSLTKTAGETITAANMTTIKNNLSIAGQTASYTATAGSLANATLGDDLITKAKAAYDQVIGLP